MNKLPIQNTIIQAPMAGVQDSALTIAVSRAGGLGSLPAAMLTHAQLSDELGKLQTADIAPFNVNFFCHKPPSPDEAREAAWRMALQPYYEELGLDQSAIQNGPGRLPFSVDSLDVIAPFKPAIVSFHFGLPDEALLAPIRAWGGQIWSSATTVDEARWLAARGVDAIIAQGLEAGGHRGMFLSDDLATQVGTLALVPQIVKAVRVPVIAAGGIASREGVRAVLGLGAIAAQVGTAFLFCTEAMTSALHRQALATSTVPEAAHTALTNLFTGRPARGIVNRVMRELGPMSSLAPAFPGATNAIAPLRAASEKQGSSDFTPLWAGQNLNGCAEVSAADMVARLRD